MMYRKRGARRTGPRPGESRKTLDIPEAVLVGAVIGKGGSTCRGLKDKFNVYCHVDGDQRKVTISGNRNAVLEAEAELERMFKEMTLKNERSQEVVAQAGQDSLWRFEKRTSKLSDNNVGGHRYQLTRAGPSEVMSTNEKESWIQPFHRFNMDNLMAHVDPSDSCYATRPRTEVVLGNLFFQLKTVDANAALTWEELQRLQPKLDYSSRWSNVCDSKLTPGVKKLVDSLEQAAKESNATWVNEMSVHVVDRTLLCKWQIKYVFADGFWKLRLHEVAKQVLGSYDILLSGKPSLRARSLARIKGSSKATEGIQRYLSICTPNENDFWSTKVTLGTNAPAGLEISQFHLKTKTRVQWQGMTCLLGYANKRRSQVRIKFKLANDAIDLLGAEENESRVLVEKVLDLFDDKDEDAEEWERWVD